jgi:hypothetical protein
MADFGAQGRIRTTDTRIFSPPPMIDFIQILVFMSRLCRTHARRAFSAASSSFASSPLGNR